MFKVYDTNRNFMLFLESQIGQIKIVESLEKGTKTLEFRVPCLDEYIYSLQEENFIETSDYKYVIKEVNMDNDSFFMVRCVADYEDLSGVLFKYFDGFEKSIPQLYEMACGQTQWTVDYQAEDHSIETLQIDMKSGLELIRMLAEEYNHELWFDTKNKVVRVYDKMGEDKGLYYSNELKIKRLTKQSDTYDFATVLYPYGKDGLTIENINDDKDYLTNYSYCDKYVEKVWYTDYEHAEDLKKAGETYLEQLCQPRNAYKVELASIGDVHLGDQIILVDRIKRIKQKQRVVKITRYPNQPEKDSVDISNLKEDFIETYLKQKKKMEADIAYIKKQIKALEDNS